MPTDRHGSFRSGRLDAGVETIGLAQRKERSVDAVAGLAQVHDRVRGSVVQRLAPHSVERANRLSQEADDLRDASISLGGRAS
jgi:hypothetical protein